MTALRDGRLGRMSRMRRRLGATISLFAYLATGWAWLILPPLLLLGGIVLRRKLESKPLIAAASRNSQGGTP